jgi:hypothetical protein
MKTYEPTYLTEVERHWRCPGCGRKLDEHQEDPLADWCAPWIDVVEFAKREADFDESAS